MELFSAKKARLRVNGGGLRRWFVGFSYEGRKMCFTRGWEQFRNYHRVRGGDFLVFTYEGGVSFEVDFFDIEGVGRTEFEERNEQITDPDMVEMSSDDEDDDIDEEASEHETERHDVEGEGDDEVEAANGMSCIMTVGNSIPVSD